MPCLEEHAAGAQTAPYCGPRPAKTCWHPHRPQDACTLVPNPADRSRSLGEGTHAWHRCCTQAELQRASHAPRPVARMNAGTARQGSVALTLRLDTWGYPAPEPEGDGKALFPLCSLLHAGLVGEGGAGARVHTPGEGAGPTTLTSHSRLHCTGTGCADGTLTTS